MRNSGSPQTIKPRWAMALIVALTLLIVGALVYRQVTGSVVTVVNKSGQTANQVTVGVKGASYPLGNLGAGHSASAAIRPRGESDVSLSYITSAGVQRQWKGGYVEGRGYRMTLVILPNGAITEQTRLKPHTQKLPKRTEKQHGVSEKG